MTLSTFEKLTLARNNRVTPTFVSSVVTTNINGFVTGFPASNLEYEDPWTMMKTDGIGVGNPTIEHQFVAPYNHRAVGILNHNLSGSFTTVMPQRWNGSTWDDLASTAIDIVGDADILIVFDAAGSANNWRLEFSPGNTSDFRIGSIFWGGIVTMAKNYINGGAIQARTVPLISETSSGGAKHITTGAQVRTATLEMTFRRATLGDVSTLQQFGKYELIGVLGPEIGDWGSGTTLNAGEIFWGYIVDRTFSPQGPGGYNTSKQATYDYTLFLEGAV